MFTDARLKIGRANKHITELSAVIGEPLAPHLYVVREHTDSKTGQKFVEFGLTEPPHFGPLALIIGYAVHNLKCALDYSWLHCVRRLARPAASRFSKFPVRESLDALRNALRGARIDDLSPPLYDFIVKKIKPYDGGDDLLWQVHRIDIADKHHLLIPILKIAIFNGITLEDGNGTTRILREHLFIGSVPYRIPLERDMKLKGHGNPSLVIAFDQGVPSHGFEILPTLHMFSKHVSMVVDEFERFFQSES